MNNSIPDAAVPSDLVRKTPSTFGGMTINNYMRSFQGKSVVVTVSKEQRRYELSYIAMK